jgi:anti-sigma B factor antagonist
MPSCDVPPAFGLQVHEAAGGSVVAVTGELDAYVASELADRLLAEIREHGDRVAVDLSDATFIDSTCLGVLLQAGRELRRPDRRLGVVCTDVTIRKIFAITGTDRVLRICETTEEALAD